jgi:hypothetical protein
MQNVFTYSHVRVIFAGLLLSPTAAIAYVGPGAGLTMLGSLWGLILAIVFVVFGLLILPFKIISNRLKKKAADAVADSEKQQEMAAGTSAEQNPTTDSD